MQVTKLILLLLLSLSLSTQAFAGALLPCQLSLPQADHGHGAMKMSASAMDHAAAMDHSQMSAGSGSSSDCCLQKCQCPKAACTSLALLNTAFIKLERPASARPLPPSIELPNTQLSPLIRPPQHA